MPTLSRWWRQARKVLAPGLADTYLPAPSDLDESAASQVAWSRDFAADLASLQRDPHAGSRKVHLTYMPIAKNVRMVATHLYRNARRGCGR